MYQTGKWPEIVKYRGYGIFKIIWFDLKMGYNYNYYYNYSFSLSMPAPLYSIVKLIPNSTKICGVGFNPNNFSSQLPCRLTQWWFVHFCWEILVSPVGQDGYLRATCSNWVLNSSLLKRAITQNTSKYTCHNSLF